MHSIFVYHMEPAYQEQKRSNGLTRLSPKRSRTAPLECALLWLVRCALEASRIW